MTGETQQPLTGSTAEQQDETPASAVQKLSSAGTSSAAAMQRFGTFAAHAGSPKLRAVALIGSLALLIITVVCAPFGALPWWSPILMLAVTGGVFWWCRASAMAARAQRPARQQVQHRPQAAAPRTARAGGVKLPERKSGDSRAARTSDAAGSKPAATPAPLTKATMPDPVVEHAPAQAGPPAEQVFDVTASAAAPAPQPQATEPAAPPVEQTPVAEAPHEQAPEDADDSWQPVAVPRPTYTMKERAPERPQQAPAATTDRRSYDDVANEDLPFDGLALDQDLDDLPSVFRAG
ncbi:hypothetical protein [Flexivirga sp. B27]